MPACLIVDTAIDKRQRQWGTHSSSDTHENQSKNISTREHRMKLANRTGKALISLEETPYYCKPFLN